MITTIHQGLKNQVMYHDDEEEVREGIEIKKEEKS